MSTSKTTIKVIEKIDKALLKSVIGRKISGITLPSGLKIPQSHSLDLEWYVTSKTNIKLLHSPPSQGMKEQDSSMNVEDNSLSFRQVMNAALERGKAKFFRMEPKDCPRSYTESFSILGIQDYENYFHRLLENGDFDREFEKFLPFSIKEESEKKKTSTFICFPKSFIYELAKQNSGGVVGSPTIYESTGLHGVKKL